MPGGRPRKYATEEMRLAARKAQIRQGVCAHRQRKALEKLNSQSDVVSPSGPASEVSESHKHDDDRPMQKIGTAPDRKSEVAEYSFNEDTSQSDDEDVEEVFCNQLDNFVRPDTRSIPRYSLDYIYLDPVLEGRIDERRQFAYFRSFVRQLSVFESDFWQRSVLQACYSSEAVRHAVLALSSLHESYQCGGMPGNELGVLDSPTSPNTSVWTIFGLRQYNKAISLLINNSTFHNATARFDSTLICCVIFICAEMLLGNESSALTHIKHGIQIINSFIPAATNFRAKIRQSESWSATGVERYVSDDEFVKTFRTLDLCAKLFLSNRTLETNEDWPQLAYPPLTDFDVPAKFETLEQAQDMVIHLLGNIYAILGGVDVALQWKGVSETPSSAASAEVIESCWEAFDGLSASMRDDLRFKHTRVLMIVIRLLLVVGDSTMPIPAEYNERLWDLVNTASDVVRAEEMHPSIDTPHRTFVLGLDWPHASIGKLH